jgi:hypothetical protein
MRAGDLGYAPRFLAIFAALSFSRFDGESRPSHLPLTLTVGHLSREETRKSKFTESKGYVDDGYAREAVRNS